MVPMAIFVADDDGRYIAVNAYACELLGYTRDELLELPRQPTWQSIPSAQERLRRDAAHRRAQRHHRCSATATGPSCRCTSALRRRRSAGCRVYIGVCWPVDD